MAFVTDESRTFILYAGCAGVFLSTFLIARMVLSEEERSAAQENLADLRNRKSTSKLVKITRPFFTQYVVPMVRGKAFWDQYRVNYKRRLISAGLREELTPDEFLAYKFFLVIFFPLVTLILNGLGFTEFEWYTVLATGGIGFFYPTFWVNGLIKKRKVKILKSLPFIVDLLALSTEAGLDFVGAIQKVVDKAASSPLIDELEQALREMKVGSSRTEALREMANRIGMSEVNSFVAILVSADQMGASIGKILKQQSDQIRNDRLLRAEKAGATAASQVILPTLIFLFPAILLLIGAPFAIALMSGNGQ